jgi:hypothetical protein
MIHTPDDGPAVDTHGSESGGTGQISSPMVAALEGAWADIRARHADVPAAVVVLGAGSIGAPAGALRLGHFAATRWTRDNGQGERLAEVFVGGEGLARGPADVLGTLLHEAAHGIAHVRGVKDTSRQGRWHNMRFKALAEEVGITVTKDPRLGWSPTTLPPNTRDTYTATLAELGRALQLHRSPEAVRSGRKSNNNPVACVCDCGRRIRVAATVLAAGPIGCGLCGADFAQAE